MFGGGGGGLDPRKMQQMMKQMGIDVTEIDAEEVVVRTPDEELVFESADVQRMDAQGQQTYQIVGEPDSRPRGEGGASAVSAGAGTESSTEASAGTEGGAEAGGATSDASGTGGAAEIPDTDVEIVAGRTSATEEEARDALAATDGDLAAAVERLE
jgi:nascent polypeptide-associated complex subunit alpha